MARDSLVPLLSRSSLWPLLPAAPCLSENKTNSLILHIHAYIYKHLRSARSSREQENSSVQILKISNKQSALFINAINYDIKHRFPVMSN